MKRTFLTAGVVTLTAGLTGHVYAQGWAGACLDPAATTSPYSTNYNTLTIMNALAGFTIGTGGTVQWGDTADPAVVPCFDDPITFSVAGGFSFFAGLDGSIQSEFDNFMAYTRGAPTDPLNSFNYALITVGDDSVENAIAFETPNIFYVGLSKRYLVQGVNSGTTSIQLEAKVLGDAVRMRWRIANQGAEPESYGLRFAFAPTLFSNSTDANGASIANLGGSIYAPLVFGLPKFTADGYVGFTNVPYRRPLRTEMKRDSLDRDFPPKVEFMFGQSDPYGMRVDNVADVSTPDATSADLIVIGNSGVILNDGGAGKQMSDVLFGDQTGGQLKDNDILNSDQSCIQRFPVQMVPPGQYRDIVHYIRSTWSVGSYTDPYTIVMDAPRVVNFPGGGVNNQAPNPLQVRVWIDNQYATIDQEVPLNNVEMTLTLPDGFSFASGDTAVKTISNVAPNAVVPVDWNIVSDGETFGDLPVTVTVKSLPGPTRSITGIVRVASAPTISLVNGPNMVSLPYQFGDSGLDAILGLTAGVDYMAYAWDGDLDSYQPVTSVQRGTGVWIVPTSAQTSLNLNNATAAPDLEAGGMLVSLKPGWNLIGNPYNYPVPLSELVGVAENNPTNSLKWVDLVRNDFVSSSLTYFDADPAAAGGGTYRLTIGDDALVEPHRAYWIFNRTAQPIRLIWPPLFQPGLPGVTSRQSGAANWKQSDREWRLQLAARSTIGVDTENYVGMVTDRRAANQLQVPKAPMAPGSKMELSILDEYSGETTRMAQALDYRMGKKSWKVQVRADEAGEVTLTWPNLGTMPRGIRARLIDDATGERKDLRAISGYTFRMDQPGTRVFTLEIEPGGSSRPVIGNVLVQPAGRDANSPMVINYALSADALVTVRIVSSTGREVFTVTRGRSDSAGENSVTWTLRDNANRAVAPGTYQVEILAETPGGDRVRKVVPVNVIR